MKQQQGRGKRERENQIEAANYCKNFSTDCVNIYKYTENDKKMLLYIEEVIFLLKLIEIRSKKFFIIHFHFYTCQIRIWLMVSYCLRHSFFWYTHKHTHTPKKRISNFIHNLICFDQKKFLLTLNFVRLGKQCTL